MLHLVYILAFTIIAFMAISNLIRSLLSVGMDSQRRYVANPKQTLATLHPELLDETGKPINEPLLVVRSVSVEDARQQLDALYNSSPTQPRETEENN